jgi:malate synthase
MTVLSDTLPKWSLEGSTDGAKGDILTQEALEFVVALQQQFNGRRLQVLEARKDRQDRLDQGEALHFPEKTQSIREGDWCIAPLPEVLQQRRTEITGPVDRKMVINALNSGASCFMADFEDANSPTWENCIDGQVNLRDAIRRQIDFTAENGKTYKLNEETATLMVRPRGWHLPEKHLLVEDSYASASLFDFGLYLFHNHQALVENGGGPFFYLPKLEYYPEARLWNDVFTWSEQYLGIEHGTIKATVLIETLPAAFHMEEILYELRDHAAGLNAGRWDYIFSAIKCFKNNCKTVLPDRAQVTMKVPFMRAYTQRLVQVCHRRQAMAIGGMAAFIPSKDEEVNKNAYEKVHADKQLEADTGFDGSWVAHPGLVPVAMDVFSEAQGDNPNQMDKAPEVEVTEAMLQDFTIPGGKITEQGVRTNLNVALLYIESWLNGQGAAALYNLMEDAATAEISRTQLWQWYRCQCTLDDGRMVIKNLIEAMLEEEKTKIRAMLGDERFDNGRFEEAEHLLRDLIFSSELKPFLTLPAYKLLD